MVQLNEGNSAAKQKEPLIFTTYYIEHGLVDGRAHYTSEDGKEVIAYGEAEEQWSIQLYKDRYPRSMFCQANDDATYFVLYNNLEGQTNQMPSPIKI